ncbi:hypothetical protein ZWY2020_038843 [Hordeum vulgare]|nr:hypothetical protein ZWY2020_038843 [Hordeum vulgare]
MSSDSDSDGVASGGVSPSSLTVGQTEDLARFGLKGRRRFWTGKSFDDIVGAFTRAAHGVPIGNIPWEAGPSCRRVAAHAPADPPAPQEVPLPPKQATLHQDGDPADMPGLLMALA